MAIANPSPVKSAQRRAVLPALIYVTLGIILGVALTLGAIVGLRAWHAAHTPDAAFLSKNRSEKDVVETPSGLQYKILAPGKGAKPTDSDVALINYEGKLTNGTTFDKSERPTPMPVNAVVPGFSEAMKLMPKGSKYRFWIKPSLGYGDKASGPIPANSVLVFDVEMLDFLPEAVVHQLQAQQQQQQMMGGAAGAPAPGAAPATTTPSAK